MRDKLIDSMVAALAFEQTNSSNASTPEAAGPTSTGPIENAKRITHGLRLCFSILELMKLDIANHQLRTLRPLLVEAAPEFEYATFVLALDEKSGNVGDRDKVSDTDLPKHPGLVKTSKWFRLARDRSKAVASQHKPQASRQLTMDKWIKHLVTDGMLELLFRPADLSESSTPDQDAPLAQGSAQGSAPASLPLDKKNRRSKASTGLPASTQIPETFQLDSFRLQLFHGDLVDLSVVYLLLLLYRQLCAANKWAPKTTDIDCMRTEIWTIMSAVTLQSSLPTATVTSPGRDKTGPTAASIRKLEDPKWREGMKDVLLQVAHRARLPTRAKEGNDDATQHIPDQATVSLVNSWMESNLKEGSKLVSDQEATSDCGSKGEGAIC